MSNNILKILPKTPTNRFYALYAGDFVTFIDRENWRVGTITSVMPNACHMR
jgi:hypothetical protein